MNSRSPIAPLSPNAFHILLALADQDLHGLAIMNEVLERTDGRLRLWPGILYRTLRQLEHDGFVVEVGAPPDAEPGGGRPRFFRITPPGRRACAAEAARLASFVAVARAKRLLKP